MTAFAQRLRAVAADVASNHYDESTEYIADRVLVAVLRELAGAGELRPSDLQFLANEIEEAGA